MVDFMKLYSNAGATLCRIIQQAEEAFLDVPRTTYSDEYLKNIKKVEFIKIMTEKLIADADIFLETSSASPVDWEIISNVIETTERRTTLEDFGFALQNPIPNTKEYSPLFDRDIRRVGKYERKLGLAYKSFQKKAADVYITKLKKIVEIDLAKFKEEEIALENLRLDHDYLRNRIDNAFTVAGRDAMEKEYEKVKLIFNKYYDNTMEYFRTIDNYFILHRKLLKEFIDIQRTHYKDCDKSLTNLMRKLYTDSFRITYDMQAEQNQEGVISSSDVDEKILRRKNQGPSKLIENHDQRDLQHDKISSVMRNGGFLLNFHRDNSISTINENENTPSPKCNGNLNYGGEENSPFQVELASDENAKLDIKANYEEVECSYPTLSHTESEMPSTFLNESDPDGEVGLTVGIDNTAVSVDGTLIINPPDLYTDRDREHLQSDLSYNENEPTFRQFEEKLEESIPDISYSLNIEPKDPLIVTPIITDTDLNVQVDPILEKNGEIKIQFGSINLDENADRDMKVEGCISNEVLDSIIEKEVESDLTDDLLNSSLTRHQNDDITVGGELDLGRGAMTEFDNEKFEKHFGTLDQDLSANAGFHLNMGSRNVEETPELDLTDQGATDDFKFGMGIGGQDEEEHENTGFSLGANLGLDVGTRATISTEEESEKGDDNEFKSHDQANTGFNLNLGSRNVEETPELDLTDQGATDDFKFGMGIGGRVEEEHEITGFSLGANLGLDVGAKATIPTEEESEKGDDNEFKSHDQDVGYHSRFGFNKREEDPTDVGPVTARPFKFKFKGNITED